MSSEQRLDRLERILLLVVRAGARERRTVRESFKETDEKINALIDAQMRHEDEYVRFKHRTDEAFAHLARAQAKTDETLNAFIANTDEKLNAFIGAVERLVNERGGEKP
jgi:hypothetical protein